MSFWSTLEKPILAVAPMADVTDVAFRRMIAKYSDWTEQKNTVMWTEFVAADGLMHATPEGKEALMADLKYAEEERPIVAQLFSGHSENMEHAAALCVELGFDGIDINMGCPVDKIRKQGAGAAMITDPENAKEVIRATKRGAGTVPVSVKTRIGFHVDEIERWIPALLEEDIAALTVHLRTKQQMSRVPAQWEKMARIVELRNQIAPHTLILGNGDVLSREDAYQKIAHSGADGAMIGRALFGNPWFFNEKRQLPSKLTALPTHGVDVDTLMSEDMSQEGIEYISVADRLAVMLEHTRLFEELLPQKHFSVMKKHYKAYVNGFPQAKELRMKLMETTSADEVDTIVHAFLKTTVV